LAATTGSGSLRRLLSGGDRRSLAGAKEAIRLIEADRGLVADLAGLTGDADWLVAMRAVDLLEKLARSRPQWVEPHKGLFIGPLADSDKWEIRLQVVRALPLFRWEEGDRARAVGILRRDIGHAQTFVRAWAADSLSRFALDDPTLMPIVLDVLDGFETSGSKALATRARNIRKRLGEAVAGDRDD